MANILITGANRGIGLGLVKEFLKLDGVGMIIATARKPDEAKELKSITDPRVKIIQLTVDDDSSIKRAVAEVEQLVGDQGLNILVNNSGILKPMDPKNPSRELLHDIFNVNVVSIAMLNAAMLPVLRKAVAKKGHAQIANISSFLGSCTGCTGNIHNFNTVAYSTSKAGLNRYTCYMAKDWADEKIRMTSLCPGWVKTDLGTQAAMFTVEECTSELSRVILGLGPEDNGKYLDRLGKKSNFDLKCIYD